MIDAAVKDVRHTDTHVLDCRATEQVLIDIYFVNQQVLRDSIANKMSKQTDLLRRL